MKNIFSFLLSTIFFFFINTEVFSQIENIKIAEVNFQNTALLFEKYETIGKNCKNNKGLEKYCLKEEKVLDNNINELLFELENTLSYLSIKYELISKKDLTKDIYTDKSFYRYVFTANAKISKKGNSCLSNPGSLIFEFYLLDRLEDKKYVVDLNYAFYICDIQILVNDINKNLKNAIKKSKS